MDAIAQQLTTLMWIHGLTAVIWFLSALVAYSSYRAFKQTTDLGWTAAFMLLGALRAGYILESQGWRDNLSFFGPEMLATLAGSVRLRLQFASVELVAVLLVLYFFRARRKIM